MLVGTQSSLHNSCNGNISSTDQCGHLPWANVRPKSSSPFGPLSSTGQCCKHTEQTTTGHHEQRSKTPSCSPRQGTSHTTTTSPTHHQGSGGICLSHCQVFLQSVVTMSKTNYQGCVYVYNHLYTFIACVCVSVKCGVCLCCVYVHVCVHERQQQRADVHTPTNRLALKTPATTNPPSFVLWHY